MKAQPQGTRSKATLLFALVLCSLRALAADAMGNPNERYPFDIPQGVAAWRLNDFGTQSGMQLLFNFEDMKGVSVSAVHGDYKPFDALDLMIKGTDIHYDFVNRRTVTLTRMGPEKVIREKADASRHGKDDRRTSNAGLDEVTIRGTYPSSLAVTGSPDLVISRADIDATGFVTAQGVIRTLPQVFGGGPTEDTFLGFEARTNPARGVGVNLRGLGASATLVLMNGRRLPGGGSEGLFVDVSNLPLVAIERIDILPDNSSTFYGSDAVGGVANFVMRDDFTGRQTEAYFGNSTRGGSFDESYVSQLIGMHTDTGHGLLAMDFYSRDALPAAARDMARSDLREYGGSNFDLIQSNPGNILLGGSTWAIPHGQDGTALKPGDFLKDSPNYQDQYKDADILMAQQRWSTFGTWRQDIGDRLSLFSDVLIGRRDVRGDGAGALGTFVVPVTNAFYASPIALPARVPLQMRYNFSEDLGPVVADARVRSTDVTSGLELHFGDHWRAMAMVGYASESLSSLAQNQVNFSALLKALARPDRGTAFNPFGDGSHTNPTTLEEIRGFTRATDRSSIRSGGLLVSGPVGRLPGGDLELSLGGDARKQALRSTLLSNTGLAPMDTQTDGDRSIRSGFAEVRAPLVGPENHVWGVEALALSAAERYEHYSDFGNSRAARLGLTWAPAHGVTIRGSYSESFRPPGLLDLDESRNSYAYTQLPDPNTGKPATVLVLGGKNRDLTEETARSWTAGMELESTQNPGAALALTYFSTNFTNRLNTPGFSLDLLSNPSLSPLVARDPSTELRQEMCDRAPQSGSGAASCLSIPVSAIVDLRYRNDAIVHTQGFDALGRYEMFTGIGRFNFSLNGTYITNFAEAKAAYQPLVNNVSTQNHPINLKLRGTTRWHRGGWDVSAYVNYLNHYEDTASTPQRHVASWTTLDLHAAYTLDARDYGWFGDTTFSFGAENILDKDPPFLNNAAASIGYDQENGDLVGRTVNFTVRKKW